jgi:hypothetical protein
MQPDSTGYRRFTGNSEVMVSLPVPPQRHPVSVVPVHLRDLLNL